MSVTEQEWVDEVPAPSPGGVTAPRPSGIAKPAGKQPRVLKGVLSLQDFEAAGRRHLPRCLFGFVSGGVETDASVRANREGFADWAFRPRMLVDASGRSQATIVFGRPYAAPFGIAPMGATVLSCRHGDLVLARAAAQANVPFILSGASLIALERIIEANPAAWFQAYVPGDRAHIGRLIDRLARAGYETLVVTADVQVSGNRENNVRNGFSLPLRPTPKLAWDGLSHPRWLFGTALRTLVSDGMPHFQNLDANAGAPVLSPDAMRDYGRRDALCWADIEWIRNRWKGRLVVKGVLAAEDARLGRKVGLDGLIVSNHGGRQLDGAIASIRALPEVVAEAGEMTVMLDSGVRRGTDVLKALALGAKWVFLGRPFLYAAAVAGEAGVRHAIFLLSEEIDRDLALLGCPDLAELGPKFLVRVPGR
jgi:L-lactate dehydrogenase (cytochrome)